MLCILQVLRELTLPLLTDTETTCTEMDIKIKRQALGKGPQNIAIAKGSCGITRIKELNLFHISMYELNSRAKIHTKGTKICKILQLHNWKLPPMAHFPIIFALFWKTYDLLQSLLKCGSRVAQNPLTKHGAKLWGQARLKDFTVRGENIIKRDHIFKYKIGCMQQPEGKTWNGGLDNTTPPLATLCKGGTVSLKKRGPRRMPRYASLISTLELAICLVGKAHLTKMKLNLNLFPIGLQIPQISYCIFNKPVICTNLIKCSAKLPLHAAERCQKVL